MKKITTAFTIPELLIFMAIVGFISVMMLTIIKPGEKYIPYAYYNAYDALSTAAYNIKEDAYANSMSDDEDLLEQDKVFPGAKDIENIDPAQELCKKLANKPGDDDYGYINASEYNCSKYNAKEFNKFNFDKDSAQYAFRASNSMTFYISQLREIKIKDALNDDKDHKALRASLI